jgi:hypothetical protein
MPSTDTPNTDQSVPVSTTTYNQAGSLPPEAVMQGKLHPLHDDIYIWRVLYDDDSTLDEIDGETLHHFRDIDLERVAGFLLIPTLQGLPQFGIQLDASKRLIFLRRRSIVVNPQSGEELGRATWHILGWQSTVEGKNVKFLQYISQNGNAFLTDDPNAV